jgi:hypothetical protein
MQGRSLNATTKPSTNTTMTNVRRYSGNVRQVSIPAKYEIVTNGTESLRPDENCKILFTLLLVLALKTMCWGAVLEENRVFVGVPS